MSGAGVRALSAVLALLLLLGGCAGDGGRCAALPGGARYCLQSAAQLAPFDAQQRVDVEYGGRRETMIAQLESDASGMRLALLTPFGQKLVQLAFDNVRVNAEPPSLQGLDPLLLLALVQIASWPAASVRAGLAETAAIDETAAAGDAPATRRVVGDGKDLVAIKYTRGRPPLADVSIALPGAGVEFTIVNLDLAEAE